MHNIEETDRQEGLEQAWHGLTVIRPDLAIDRNFLTEWEIEPRTVAVFNKGTNEYRELPGVMQLVTNDTGQTIGMPYNAETFRPLTNQEFLKLVTDAVTGTDHKLVSIGTIRSRGRRFASFHMESLEKFSAGGRTFEPFLNFGDGLDKSSLLWANTSNTCTVCDNTFSMNMVLVETAAKNGNNNGFTFQGRHTKNIVSRLPSISDLIDKAIGVQAEFAKTFENLASKPVKEDQARRIYAGFIAAPDVEKLSDRSIEKADRLVDLFKNGRGNRGESRADLFSGATDYYTHEGSGRRKNATAQFVSSEFGTGWQRKQEFWQLVQNEEKLEATEKRGAEVLPS